MDYFKIVAAFLEGLGIILSPCILPILPLMLSGGIAAGKKRPFGIILGFVVMFSIVTLFLRELVGVSGIMPNLIRHVSLVVLALFGVVMLFDVLYERFSLITQRFGQVGARSASLNNPDGGFFSGLLLGALISIIWTPCAGPLLAAVIVETITSQTTLTGYFIVLAFALGSAVPMLIITLLGRGAINRLGFLKRHPKIVRKVLGVILIVAAGLLASGISTNLVVGQSSTIKGKSHVAEKSSSAALPRTTLLDALSYAYPAPKFQQISHWINSKPLTMSELKGKVVLVDFWTYSCINCLRTIPFIKQLYQHYHDKGLVVVGVHSPEFPFEHNLANVTAAVKRLAIPYPVALDNNFATFTGFGNRYWPAQYLINQQGRVVYTHFGEGGEEILAHNIQVLLGVKVKQRDHVVSKAVDFNQTPETYLGLQRQSGYAGRQFLSLDAKQYHYPNSIPLHRWALSGWWANTENYLQSAGTKSAITVHFNAKNVYIVAGALEGKSIPVQLYLNGRPMLKNQGGRDVVNGSVLIKGLRLYRLVALAKVQDAELELRVKQPGFRLYTFTFG